VFGWFAIVQKMAGSVDFLLKYSNTTPSTVRSGTIVIVEGKSGTAVTPLILTVWTPWARMRLNAVRIASLSELVLLVYHQQVLCKVHLGARLGT
jgi:hypothetical protein